MDELSPEDVGNIRQTLALFAHVFDNKEVADLGLVFTEDAVIELTRGAGRTIEGLAAIGELAVGLGADAPDHHTLDTHVSVDADGTVRARSRYLAILPDGSVHNGDYLDVLERTPGGWRIGRRVSVPRYPRAAENTG
ncbi:nuclear transport factor 2 family protein [Acrocarpospora macrocephala]|uniref:nuclear transport factor 2 family protein n=1 Tax=Acrocarpospora macrocephala TaxID=150177 RepID=UPI0012D2EFE8|nr:nuclear transport factor 2 family protein [Acrocarpospora macrocephala]